MYAQPQPGQKQKQCVCYCVLDQFMIHSSQASQLWVLWHPHFFQRRPCTLSARRYIAPLHSPDIEPRSIRQGYARTRVHHPRTPPPFLRTCPSMIRFSTPTSNYLPTPMIHDPFMIHQGQGNSLSASMREITASQLLYICLSGLPSNFYASQCAIHMYIYFQDLC